MATHRPPAPRRPAPGTSSPSASPGSRSSTAGNGQSPPGAAPGTRTCRAWLLTGARPAPPRGARPETLAATGPAPAGRRFRSRWPRAQGAAASRAQLPPPHSAPCAGRTEPAGVVPPCSRLALEKELEGKGSFVSGFSGAEFPPESRKCYQPSQHSRCKLTYWGGSVWDVLSRIGVSPGHGQQIFPPCVPTASLAWHRMISTLIC